MKAKAKPLNSRRKGAAGERELASLFREHGFAARRGQQFKGSGDSPDIVQALEWLHVECKRTESLNVYKAMDQAEADAGFERKPAVFHRRNGKPWLVVMLAEDFFDLAKAKEGENAGGHLR